MSGRPPCPAAFFVPKAVRRRALLIAALILLTGNARALPCKGLIVNVGDTEGEVAAKCGEAMLKEQRTVKQEETDESGASTSTTTAIDEWTFDFGPDELMQTYRFENGKLVDIENIGYGRLPDATTDTCRNGELLAVGDSSRDVFLKCGEPLAKVPQEDKVVETTIGGRTRRKTVPVSEWTYRYGPDAPGYTLRIENGTVTEIRMREFGK